jgi:hypothetical protein
VVSINDIAASLASAVPGDGYLDEAELVRVAAMLPRLLPLESLGRHDPGARTYRPLYDDDRLEAWLICWMNDHDTGYHDHDLSAGAVAVVHGSLAEDRLRMGQDPATTVFGPGSVFSFDTCHIHRMRHVGTTPAMSVHVYSPPLVRMGTYDLNADGVLRRASVPAAVELTATPGLAALV